MKKKKKLKNTSKRANHIVIEYRVSKVREWLADGLQRADMCKLIQTKEDATKWDISLCKGGGLDDYIHRVREELRKEAEKSRPFRLEESELKKRRLYNRAVAKQDYATARAILFDLDKLQGNITDRGMSVQVPITGDGFDLTEEESKRLAQELGVVFNKKG
jgi:xanthine/CO dehydrogenase XdhC/CoxF family maturation factor